MKSIIIIIISILSLALMSSISNQQFEYSKLLPPTLDSMQGSWISDEDSLLQWNIVGTTMDEFYNDEDSIKNHH